MTVPDVDSEQFKFTLLDGSRGLHISESTVSISYTFSYQRTLSSYVKGQENGLFGSIIIENGNILLATNFQTLNSGKVNNY
jgi:hypothetical protein